MSFNIFKDYVNEHDYIIVDYFLESKTNLCDAAWNLAIGQSVGNPNVRNSWETDSLFENHSALVLGQESQLMAQKSGNVKIAFPVINIDFTSDGVSHLLCTIMGGQLDIDLIQKCHVLNVTYPDVVKKHFLGPKFGISGIRSFTGAFDKPLLGGIVKPKIGIRPDVLLEMVKEMVEGGVNFIKEDEIMSNPQFCTIEERVPLIMDYLKDKKVIYAVCINADPAHILDRVRQVYKLGGNAVHINFWSGLGVYKSVRELDLPIFMHFQKSGDKILTNKNHDYHIDWDVICQLATMMGADTIHSGMWGGYMSDNEDDLKKTLDILVKGNTLPALSCGMHPGLVGAINSRFGVDYMANVGGAMHGHPGGTRDGSRAMRQAIDNNHGPEYDTAIEKWGLVK
jgi:ribulose-bisphosphate carboxylase large chain